jgi:hypothetical protein
MSHTTGRLFLDKESQDPIVAMNRANGPSNAAKRGWQRVVGRWSAPRGGHRGSSVCRRKASGRARDSGNHDARNLWS